MPLKLLSLTNRNTTSPGSFPYDWYIMENTNKVDFNQSGFAIGDGQHGASLPGIRIINCILHDNLQGLGLARTYDGKYVYGCLIYYNGWHAPDRNHGHGFYSEHQGPNQDYAIDNLVFCNFGQGAQNYGSRYTYADRGTWEGNAFWMNGLMASNHQSNFSVGTGTGSTPAEGSQILRNMTYTDTNGCGSDFNLGYTGGMQNGLVQSNYLGSCCQFVGIDHSNNLTISSNTFAGGTRNIDYDYWVTNTFVATGFDDNTHRPARGTPSGTQVFVRPNLHESGRGNIIIYNWGTNDFVNVDISSIGLTNGQYELHQANNYFGEVSVLPYTTNIISICMTNGSAALPVGQYSQPSTFPIFAAFVIKQH